MDKLKLWWPHPQVEFNGRGISEAWLEAMLDHGFIPAQTFGEAEEAFFISDSQLDKQIIGSIPTVAYFWGWLPERLLDPGFRTWAVEKLNLLEKCTRILVPSLGTRDQLLQFGIGSQVCPPGVDARSLDSATGFVERKLEIGFLSRMAEHKGLDLLIRAISALEPKIHLLVMGPGDPTPYAMLAKDMGVPVRLQEPTDQEKAVLLREIALLVHPSSYEGWGLPPLEALAVGTPVVVQDTPHMRWLLRDAAFYFASPHFLPEGLAMLPEAAESLAVQDLASTIITALSNYPAAEEKAHQGQERVRRLFTMDMAAQRLWAHLHQTHKQFWATKMRANLSDKDLVRQAYEAEHRRNWAYGLSNSDVNAPSRFDPEWARHWRAQHFIGALKEGGAVNILDLGCGAVYPVIFARAGFQVTGMDVSEEALSQAQSLAEKWGVADRVVTQQGYAQALPYPGETFDAVVLGEILEHVPDPERVLAEAMRVVKAGGLVVASTPIGHHHYDPYHMATAKGGWDDAAMERLLFPWKLNVVKVEKIAEEGTDPSCYLVVLRKGVQYTVEAGAKGTGQV